MIPVYVVQDRETQAIVLVTPNEDYVNELPEKARKYRDQVEKLMVSVHYIHALSYPPPRAERTTASEEDKALL